MIFRFLKNNIEKTHENTKDFLDFMPRISETQQKIMVHNIFEQIIKTLLEPYYGATYRLQDLFSPTRSTITCSMTFTMAAAGNMLKNTKKCVADNGRIAFFQPDTFL